MNMKTRNNQETKRAWKQVQNYLPEFVAYVLENVKKGLLGELTGADAVLWHLGNCKLQKPFYRLKHCAEMDSLDKTGPGYYEYYVPKIKKLVSKIIG